METPVLDPAAAHAAEDVPPFVPEDELAQEPEPQPAPEEPDEPEASESLDEYGPPTLGLSLVFETEANIPDAQQVWKVAQSLIDSAAAKGLTLKGGQVFQAQSVEDLAQDLADEQVDAALAELAKQADAS